MRPRPDLSVRDQIEAAELIEEAALTERRQRRILSCQERVEAARRRRQYAEERLVRMRRRLDDLAADRARIAEGRRPAWNPDTASAAVKQSVQDHLTAEVWLDLAVDHLVDAFNALVDHLELCHEDGRFRITAVAPRDIGTGQAVQAPGR